MYFRTDLVGTLCRGNNASYMATITPAVSDTVTVDIAAGAARDAGGNPSAAAVQFSIVADLTPVPALPVIGALALLLLGSGARRRTGELTRRPAATEPRCPVRRPGGGRGGPPLEAVWSTGAGTGVNPLSVMICHRVVVRPQASRPRAHTSHPEADAEPH